MFRKCKPGNQEEPQTAGMRRNAFPSLRCGGKHSLASSDDEAEGFSASAFAHPAGKGLHAVRMKAQFYSMIAVALAIPIFVFTVYYVGHSGSLGDAVSERVISDQMKQLADSIELDTAKAIEISGRRALLEATSYVVSSGEPLSDASENITALMLTGILNGSESFLMGNNTMPDWDERISAKDTNFDVSIEYGNLTVENGDGFSIHVAIDVNVTVTEKFGRARIQKFNVRKDAYVSVIGLEDPLFPMRTQGFIRRTIREAPLRYAAERLVAVPTYAYGNCTGLLTFNKSEVDVSKILAAENLSGVVYARHLGIILSDSDNMSGQIGCYLTGNASAYEILHAFSEALPAAKAHIDQGSKSAWSFPVADDLQGRYYYAGGGPDFLERLEGKLVESGDGVSTFVYVPELEEQALTVTPNSRVDWRYFAGDGDCYQVTGLPAWFGMDASDAARYGLTALLTAKSCESESS
jgi:hypothetical protein